MTARCIFCKATKEIYAGEIPKGEMPVCPKCFSPMIAERAEAR